jgi:hypothetical protein
MKFVSTCFLQFLLIQIFGQTGNLNTSEQRLDKVQLSNTFGVEGSFYTIDVDGSLFVLNTAIGDWQKKGEGYDQVKFFFEDQNHLVFIDKGGTLFEVEKETGKKLQLGLGGSWSAVVAGAFFNGLLYVVENTGSINTIDFVHKNWNQLSSLGFSDIKGMWLSNGKFYLLQIDGSLYAVSPKNGSWEQVGSHQIWANTFSGAILDEFLYTCDVTGKYYKTNLLTGNITRLEADNSNELVMLSTRNNKIMVIKKDGSISTLKAE